MSGGAREVGTALQSVTAVVATGDAEEATGGGPLDRRKHEAVLRHSLKDAGEVPASAAIVNPFVGGVVLPRAGSAASAAFVWMGVGASTSEAMVRGEKSSSACCKLCRAPTRSDLWCTWSKSSNVCRV